MIDNVMSENKDETGGEMGVAMILLASFALLLL